MLTTHIKEMEVELKGKYATYVGRTEGTTEKEGQAKLMIVIMRV